MEVPSNIKASEDGGELKDKKSMATKEAWCGYQRQAKSH
jgi:hypothetical protein